MTALPSQSVWKSHVRRFSCNSGRLASVGHGVAGGRRSQRRLLRELIRENAPAGAVEKGAKPGTKGGTRISFIAFSHQAYNKLSTPVATRSRLAALPTFRRSSVSSVTRATVWPVSTVTLGRAAATGECRRSLRGRVAGQLLAQTRTSSSRPTLVTSPASSSQPLD